MRPSLSYFHHLFDSSLNSIGLNTAILLIVIQMLFSTDFTQSLQQDWRSGQFSCRRCGSSLVAQRYILRDDQPYCKKCYEELFANQCVACKTPITTDYKVC